MSKPLLLIVSVALLTACGTTNQGRDTSFSPAGHPARVSNLFAEYHEERLKLYPMEATMAGDHRYDDLLPNNLTEAFRASESAFYRKYLAALKGINNRGRLPAEDQMSCDILQWECERQLDRLRFPMHLMPINQFSSLYLDMGQWAGGTSAQPFKTVRDYENWLKRLDAFTAWCHTAVANMREGINAVMCCPKRSPEKPFHKWPR